MFELTWYSEHQNHFKLQLCIVLYSEQYAVRSFGVLRRGLVQESATRVRGKKLDGVGFDYQVDEQQQSSSAKTRTPAANFLANNALLPKAMIATFTVDHEVKTQDVATQKSEMAKLQTEKLDHLDRGLRLFLTRLA